MSFHEKSAWVMCIGLLIPSTLYFALVFTMIANGDVVALGVPIMVIYTIILTLIAIVGHIVIAVLAPKDANASEDERERSIAQKSSHISGNVLGFLVICSLMLYLVLNHGAILFYCVFASLIVSQISEYALRIYFHRRFFQ